MSDLELVLNCIKEKGRIFLSALSIFALGHKWPRVMLAVSKAAFGDFCYSELVITFIFLFPHNSLPLIKNRDLIAQVNTFFHPVFGAPEAISQHFWAKQLDANFNEPQREE